LQGSPSAESETVETSAEKLPEESAELGAAATSLIVRHTSRRLGSLEPDEARERLILGSISFSEFVDQVGDDFKELLEFMTENDLHPGRPGEVLYCIERSCDASAPLDGRALRGQLTRLYNPEHRRR
jgi:hypothetical protein